MSRQEVDIGVVGNDGTGDSIREAFRKVNDNFKEIYAIFNLGDSISIQDLDNVPNTLRPNRVLATDGTGLLVKDRELVEGAGIEIDVTDPESIVISSTGGSIITDEEPKLGGPLNASGFGIANVGPPNIDTLNTYLGKHGGSVTINDFVITKGYADKSYLRKTGGSSSVSGQIRVRDEPVNNSEYTLTVNGNINNNIIVNNHGFDSGFDGASYIYLTNGINANGLAQVITVTDSNHFIVGRSYRIESLGNVDFTSIGALRNRVGEIFTLTNTGSIVGYGTVNNLEGGSPSSIPSDTIDGGTPSTTTFTSTYNGGTPAVVVGGSTGTVRPVYFLKYVNTSQLSIHPTFVAAQEGSPKINFNGGTGNQLFRDAYYDVDLEGNWLSNEVLPRKSVVRRQGDKMDGPLFLNDHPFPLQGVGTPNRPDDLQAATKYYVDNSSFASMVNLYVSTTGSDQQVDIPANKEGRAWPYAFASVGKACEVAEYMMANAPLEPGPYRQLISSSNIVSGITQVEYSVVTTYTAPQLTGLARVKFTNNSGGPVDQGTTPTIEIIPGKLLKGKTSGATGIIYNYETDSSSTFGEDYIDLQQVTGTFLPGENLEFGDPVKNLHITIHVESGIYEEDYPIRIPDNTAIVGDEFRRVLIRPKDRISRSPWVYTWFFRNNTFDQLTIAKGNINTFNAELGGYYGYHYLKDPTKLVDRGVNYVNTGGYTSEANTIKTNRSVIQFGIKNYINALPGTPLNSFEEETCIRDVGYIVDAIISDLETGGMDKILDQQEIFSTRTLSSNYSQGLNYIDNFINTNIISTSSAAIKTLITNMIEKIMFGFNVNYNTPKNNKDIDVFLCNDSAIVRQVTCQGHGGFMMVLDPVGQILSKSPYCQQSGSFSGSVNQKSFRGGQYIDGFTGNLTATVVQKISNTLIKVTDMPREPKMPSSFFIDGQRFKVDSWVPEDGSDTNARDLLLVNKFFIQLQTLNYLETQFPLIKFSRSEIERHTNRFINAITFDITLGGNSKTLEATRRLFDPSNEFLLFNDNIKPVLLGMLDYIKETICAVIINQTVTANQNQITQVKIVGRSGTVGSQNKTVNLINNVKLTIEQGLDQADGLDTATFVLVLDPSTPLTTNPPKVTLITPGNTSMLSNDFTQVNDLGYGIVTNNNGLSECVSVFSYYCWTGMFSNNGGQIRSLNSSTANGEYGLVAAGSDPLEIPDQVTLVDDSVQVARVVKTGLYASSGAAESLSIYVEDYQFLPYNVSIVEINHGSTVGIVRYEMNNITIAEPGIIRLNFNTAGNNNTSTGGLAAAVNDGDKVIIRSGQNFKFKNVLDTNPTRPSTALTFEGDPANDQTAPVYRVISYNIKGPDNASLNVDEAILTFDSTYNYIPLIVNNDRISTVDGSGTMGNTAGDTKIAIRLITSAISISRLNTGQMLIAWDGKIHRIVSYTAVTAQNYGYITISDLDSSGVALPNLNGSGSGINSSFNPLINTNLKVGDDVVLRVGLAKNENANVTVRISTMRATGHDFLDVGTGGYNTSNYPNKIYGDPRSPIQSREVEERSRGRVFYVSTDQDGFFRVGRFFTVDQGTGTVTFAASIALSNLDGLGFKRGISISEFSSDDGFTDLAEDTVPTEAAISSYIDRRLGVDRDGYYLDSSLLFDVPGFIARNADTPTKGPTSNISWNSKRLTDLATPIATYDATTKNYVDTAVSGFSNLKQLRDVLTTTSSPGEILAFASTSGEAVATSIGGDLESSIDSQINTTLDALIPATGGITAIEVDDASQFPDDGYVLIDDEIFYYNGRTTGSGAEQLDGVIRLSIQTTNNYKFTNLDPASHSIGATVHSLNTAQLNLQIKSDTIVNADINSNAGIVQSKLSLNLSTSSNAAPTGTAGDKQAASGLSSFDDDNFEVTDGWVKVKDGGIARIEIENIAVNKILGNLDTTANYPQELTPESVLKRATWDSINAVSTIQRDHVFTFRPSTTEAASVFTSTEINTNVTSNSLVKRTATGNIKVSNIDSNGGISIIAISGSVILNGLAFVGSGVFTCNPSTLVVGSRIFVSGINTGDLVLPNYNPGGTNYFIIDTNGTTQFTLSTTLGGSPVAVTGTTISGLTFINQSGTEDTSTPVIYKGQWSPGNAATLRATSADKWATSRTITIAGDSSGTISLDGTSDLTLTLTNGYATSSGTAGQVQNNLTFNNSGNGDVSGTTFDGLNARTISYNSIGAVKTDGTGATGTWSIGISGNAATATTAGSTTTVTTGGSVTTTVITTGGPLIPGTITGAWTLTAGSTLQSTYADLAEWYVADKVYAPGTVLVFGGVNEVTTTKEFCDQRVAGVVTTNPAYVLNDGIKDQNNAVCIALQGRIPCMVIGQVRKGDLIVTSTREGYAVRGLAPSVGTVIGKALEDKDTTEPGIIEIAVGRC